jgi:hypothetical protein
LVRRRAATAAHEHAHTGISRLNVRGSSAERDREAFVKAFRDGHVKAVVETGRLILNRIAERNEGEDNVA